MIIDFLTTPLPIREGPMTSTPKPAHTPTRDDSALAKEIAEGIVSDLAEKAASDVGAALKRIFVLTDRGHLPIAMMGAATALGYCGAMIAMRSGVYVSDRPDEDSLLLACLFCARIGLGQEMDVAFKDLRAVNAHADLIAALKTLTDAATYQCAARQEPLVSGEADKKFIAALKQARAIIAAIAKQKGGET